MPCHHPAGASVVGHSLRPIGLGGASIEEAWPQACSGIKGRMPPQPFVHRVEPFSGTTSASEAFLTIKGMEERQSASVLPHTSAPRPSRVTNRPALQHFEPPNGTQISYLT